MKCSICVSYCPVLATDPSFPGPKSLGPDGERYRRISADFYDKAIKYCLNCKRCEVACPSGVQVADLILSAKLKFSRHDHVLRNAALSHTDIMGYLGSTFAPIANVAAGLLFKGGPRYASRRFETLYHREVGDQKGFERKVSYFHGCYVNYNNPQLGLELIKVLNSLGVGVELLAKEKCCGIALISNGFIGQAKRQALSNISAIGKSVDEGLDVVTTSSTCAFTIRDEYKHVLGLDTKSIRSHISTATKYICKLLDEGASLKFKDNLPRIKVAYHVPCHLEKLGWEMYTIALLKMIPGVELIQLDSACCGVAGTFGFKAENKKLSKAIGSPLFKQIEDSGADIVVTDCETCRWQIEMNTSAQVVNPITLLANSII